MHAECNKQNHSKSKTGKKLSFWGAKIMTELQRQIILLVLAGKKNIEIAEELGYCENWVAKNLKKIYDCFKVNNRASFIREFLINYKNCDL